MWSGGCCWVTAKGSLAEAGTEGIRRKAAMGGLGRCNRVRRVQAHSKDCRCEVHGLRLVGRWRDVWWLVLTWSELGLRRVNTGLFGQPTRRPCVLRPSITECNQVPTNVRACQLNQLVTRDLFALTKRVQKMPEQASISPVPISFHHEFSNPKTCISACLDLN